MRSDHGRPAAKPPWLSPAVSLHQSPIALHKQQYYHQQNQENKRKIHRTSLSHQNHHVHSTSNDNATTTASSPRRVELATASTSFETMLTARCNQFQQDIQQILQANLATMKYMIQMELEKALQGTPQPQEHPPHHNEYSPQPQTQPNPPPTRSKYSFAVTIIAQVQVHGPSMGPFVPHALLYRSVDCCPLTDPDPSLTAMYPTLTAHKPPHLPPAPDPSLAEISKIEHMSPRPLPAPDPSLEVPPTAHMSPRPPPDPNPPPLGTTTQKAHKPPRPPPAPDPLLALSTIPRLVPYPTHGITRCTHTKYYSAQGRPPDMGTFTSFKLFAS